MGISYNPSIVTEGLVLALDPQSPRFYNYKGRSVAFDGSGDYLDIGSSTDFAFGTGDFTIEVWVYLKSNSVGVIYSNEVANSLFLYLDSGNLVVRNYGTTNLFDLAGPSLNTWTHIALSRSGTDLRLFFNGVQQGSTVTNSTNWTQNGTEIGAFNNGTQSLNGYLSNLRIVKGTALYTSNFTPPRSLLTAVANTSLLTCQKGSITDASSNNFAITVNGDARPVYGFPSFKFDGTNDYVTAPNNADFDFGSGDFTVEYWINFSTVSGIRGIFGKRVSEVNYAPILMYLQSSALQLLMSTSGSSWNVSLSTSTLSTGSWNHVAVFRSGTTVYLFLNGTSIGSTGTVSGALISNTAPLTVGVDSTSPSGSTPLNGYISNFRIYKGKGLTAAEVKQNYRNTKGRYGL